MCRFVDRSLLAAHVGWFRLCNWMVLALTNWSFASLRFRHLLAQWFILCSKDEPETLKTLWCHAHLDDWVWKLQLTWLNLTESQRCENYSKNTRKCWKQHVFQLSVKSQRPGFTSKVVSMATRQKVNYGVSQGQFFLYLCMCVCVWTEVKAVF